jgi:hypothetical protein
MSSRSTPTTDHDLTLPDVPRGCAWFDSSLDLLAGLKVRELDLADSRCGDAFLAGWLAWATAGGEAAQAVRA